MVDDKDLQKRTFNDVLGAGEAIKSFFNLLTVIVKKLPFTKLTAFQTQFIVIVIIIHTTLIVLESLKVVDGYAYYPILIFDLFIGYQTFKLAKEKNSGKQ